MKTRITELFGIEHPVVLSGMGTISEPKLAAAVCNAGGLGILGSSSYMPEDLRRAVREMRDLTDRPFGINQTLMSPMARANIDVAIEEQVPIVNYSLGKPWFVDQVHEYGGKVLATVVIARHAVRAKERGVDALMVTGHEAAGHSGRATLTVLLPLIADRAGLPIVAAGGSFDGRGLASALALGADAIAMGSRFATSAESVLHDKWKHVALAANEQDTIYLDRHLPALRAYDNDQARLMNKRSVPVVTAAKSILAAKRMLGIPMHTMLLSGLKMRKGPEGMNLREQTYYAMAAARFKKLALEGDEQSGPLSLGQSIGGIEEILTCREIIEGVVVEARTALERAHTAANA